mgnify:CR=1 FL=1|tara:strand:- start:54 stop:1256 length:1203 start_codon:yes stop_codon:yes gene_type:complete
MTSFLQIPNGAHPLLKECVLHNVLPYLPLNSVLSAIVLSREFKTTALHCPFVRIGDSLSPDRARLCRVLRRFHHVARVHVENAELLSKSEDFEAFASVVPHVVDLSLTKLRLNRTTGGSFVQSFAQHLQRLRILSLNGCMFPTADVLTEMVSHLNGRSLSFISLVGCRTLEDQHVNTLLSKCSTLTTLLLPDCTRLRRPNLVHGSLEEIDLSKCTSIEAFPQVRLPKVRTICLEWCRNLIASSIENIVRTSPSLISLEMGGCVAFHQLQLSNGRSLETLRFGMCESIRTLRIENCPTLSNLHLGLCVGLNRLELINCPLLIDVDASLLSDLKGVHIERCVGMQSIDVTTTTEPPTVTLLPLSSQKENTKVIDECARLNDPNCPGPGQSGVGTGMATKTVE